MMPRSYSNVYTPTNGVRTDFKRLMNRFLSSATVRFEQFSEVWRALNMSYLCAGRNTDREAREVMFLKRGIFLAYYNCIPTNVKIKVITYTCNWRTAKGKMKG